MTRRRRISLLSAGVLLASGCFGEYAPGAVETDVASGSTASAASTTTDVTSTTGEVASSSSSTGPAPVCEHLDILFLTDVSVSMAPFAQGIINVILALGTRVDETFGGVGSFNLAFAYNAPPNVNEQAVEVPPNGEGCTQLGALVRGVDDCVYDYDGRPYLTEGDDLGAGMTCLAGGLIAGQWSPLYETPQTLDTIVAFLEGESTLSACNAGFHTPPNPLLIILIVDSEDESQASVIQAVTAAVAARGTSLESVGLFVIGADASGCPDDQPNACNALPACRVQEFIQAGFTNVGLSDNVRRFNICRALEEDAADVADDLLGQLSAVISGLCT